MQGSVDAGLDAAEITTLFVPDSLAGRLGAACAGAVPDPAAHAVVLAGSAWTMLADSDASAPRYRPGTLTDKGASIAKALLSDQRFSALTANGATAEASGPHAIVVRIPVDVSGKTARVPLSATGETVDTAALDTARSPIVLRALVTIGDGRITAIAVSAPGASQLAETNLAAHMTISYGVHKVTAPKEGVSGSPRPISTLTELVSVG